MDRKELRSRVQADFRVRTQVLEAKVEKLQDELDLKTVEKEIWTGLALGGDVDQLQDEILVLQNTIRYSKQEIDRLGIAIGYIDHISGKEV